MLKIFKDFENWDPEGARLADEEVKRIAVEASGLSEERYKTAVNIVYYDGFHGPIQDYEFEEAGEFFGDFANFAEAHQAVVKAIDASYPDFEYLNPDYSYDCCGSCEACLVEEECIQPLNNCKIEGSDIRNEMFSWYKRIYGGF